MTDGRVPLFGNNKLHASLSRNDSLVTRPKFCPTAAHIGPTQCFHSTEERDFHFDSGD